MSDLRVMRRRAAGEFAHLILAYVAAAPGESHGPYAALKEFWGQGPWGIACFDQEDWDALSELLILGSNRLVQQGDRSTGLQFATLALRMGHPLVQGVEPVMGRGVKTVKFDSERRALREERQEIQRIRRLKSDPCPD